MLIQSDKLPAVQHTKDHLNPPENGLDAEVLAVVLKDLSFALSEAAEVLQHTSVVNNGAEDKIEEGIDFYSEVARFKISLIRSALAHTNGKQKRAAQLLHIRLSTLNAMIKRLGIGTHPITTSKKM